MQVFDAIKAGQHRVMTIAFTDDIPDRRTIASCVVTAAVYDKSNPKFPDATPANTISGDATLNGDVTEVQGRDIAAGEAVSQEVIGQVAGCIYVLTFKATLDNGEELIEDALLPVNKYAPTL